MQARSRIASSSFPREVDYYLLNDGSDEEAEPEDRIRKVARLDSESNIDGSADNVAHTDVLPEESASQAETRSDSAMIHVLYGPSKDFGLNALRLGFLVTQNPMIKECWRRIAVSTWVTTFSDRVFTAFLNDDDFFSTHMQQYQIKLAEAHARTTSFLQDHGIPFAASNASLFVWIDLSAWLKYFPKPDLKSSMADASQEMQLTRHPIKHGAFLNPSEAKERTAFF
ncbi:hypothetical protein V1525DRAFT_387515 [Lipomyces kononenkoae]|uniref:Uncharacterized protein n=1 Tax=Lipomyces kononenkoae TaxID=34357 RepID=A0ACC3T6D4_LIPKO